jgi:hypothetical protein
LTGLPTKTFLKQHFANSQNKSKLDEQALDRDFLKNVNKLSAENLMNFRNITGGLKKTVVRDLTDSLRLEVSAHAHKLCFQTCTGTILFRNLRFLFKIKLFGCLILF